MTYEWSPQQTLEAVKLLLDLGADVNAQDLLDGRTALMGAAHKGRNDVIELLVAHGADLSLRDIGSRDSIHALAGVRWQAIDYADGLVRVGVQSAIAHPETSALLRKMMKQRHMEVPQEGRTLASICVTDLCRSSVESREHARDDSIAMLATELEDVPLGEVDLFRERFAQQAFRAEVAAAYGGFGNAQRLRGLFHAQLFH